MRTLFHLPSRLFSKHVLARQLCTYQHNSLFSQRRAQTLENLSCKSIRRTLWDSKPQNSVMQSLVGLCHERIEYEQQVLEEDVEDQLTDLMGELHAISHDADCCEQSLVSKNSLSLAEQISLSYLGFPEGVEEQVCAPYPTPVRWLLCARGTSHQHIPVQPQLAVPMMGPTRYVLVHIFHCASHAVATRQHVLQTPSSESACAAVCHTCTWQKGRDTTQ